jgi:hypothetical protein
LKQNNKTDFNQSPQPNKLDKLEPILYEYLKINKSSNMSPPNLGTKGKILKGKGELIERSFLRTIDPNNNAKLISYNFNCSQNMKVINSQSIGWNPIISSIAPSTPEGPTFSTKRGGNWYLIEDLQKIFISYFKSIYSLISKAKYKFYSDKVTIEILYYITIPDANIFTWYNIIYKTKSQTPLSDNWSGSLDQSQLQVNNGFGRKLQRKINYLKRKNKLIKFLKKNMLSVSQSPAALASRQQQGDLEGSVSGEKFFKLNLTNINNLYSFKFNSLVKWLNSIFNKPVELELIRLHHSDSDSNILAQLFFLVIKKKNIRSVINKLFNKNKVKDINKIIPFKDQNNNKNLLTLPVFISGLYVNIGGRLMREPIIPRLTTKKFEKGAIALGKVNNLEETQITKKNKKGAYTIKITFAQNII